MKILVLSDSHGSMGAMRRWVARVRPDALVHLGDHYEDGQTLGVENPHIPLHQVPGNCDLWGMRLPVPSVLCYDVFGVRMFMTHGHEHWVKQTQLRLLQAARKEHARMVLYGHTHEPYCRQEPDGLWVLNPGAAGLGYAGLVLVEEGKILSCRLLNKSDLEETV